MARRPLWGRKRRRRRCHQPLRAGRRHGGGREACEGGGWLEPPPATHTPRLPEQWRGAVLLSDRREEENLIENAGRAGRQQDGLRYAGGHGTTNVAPAQTGDPYGDRDITVFNAIRDSTIAKDFEDFLGPVSRERARSYARNRLALLKQRETVPPPPSVTARMDPATEEMGLNLRSEDRIIFRRH